MRYNSSGESGCEDSSCSGFGTALEADESHRWESTMDVQKMLAELRQEREQIEEAIITLERLARGRGKRRGRPPAWMTAAKKRIKLAEAKKAASNSKAASA